MLCSMSLYTAMISFSFVNNINLFLMGQIKNHELHRLIDVTEYVSASSFCVSDLFSITSK